MKQRAASMSICIMRRCQIFCMDILSPPLTSQLVFSGTSLWLTEVSKASREVSES